MPARVAYYISVWVYYTNMNVIRNIFLLDCCVECNAALVAEHFTEGEVFENANIYVRKITDERSKEDVQVITEVRNCSVQFCN